MAEKYISRKVACNLSFSHGLNEDGILYIPYYEAINYLQNISPADVRPVVRGEWIPYKQGDMKCSNCGGVYGVCAGLLGDYNYCPRCGADMRGVDNE